MDALRLLDYTGVLINLYYACTHRPSLKCRCFRCCGRCAAAARAPQFLSSVNFHATPVEWGYCLIGSHGVAIILPKTLATNHQRDLNWEIPLYVVPKSSGLVSKGVWFENHLLSNCACGRPFYPCAAQDVVPGLPSAARQPGKPQDLYQ